MPFTEYVVYTLSLPHRLVCTLILWVMGWKLVIDPFPPGNRVVAIFSHSSRWDFIMYLLYKQSLVWPTNSPPVYVMVMPQVFDYLHGWLAPLLTWLGAIPAARLEEKGTGVTKRVISVLNRTPRFGLLISPKGCTVKAPWRSGYYYLARDAGADFCVTGMDYQKKSVVYCDLILTTFGEGKNRLSPGERDVANHPPLTTKEEIEEELKHQLSMITPLHPQGEICEFKVKESQSLLGPRWHWRLLLLVELFIASCCYRYLFV